LIVSFGDARTQDVYNGVRAKGLPPDILRVAFRKLDMLNIAHALNDLRIPPANRLEQLQGNLTGHHSIRINNQWRIVFRWVDGNVEDVRIVDYH